MKNNFIKTLFFCSLITLLPSACHNHDNKAHSHEENDHDSPEHTNDLNTSNIVTLTQEQINEVNIEFGKIEMKDLTATIKANGVLRVPNNSKGLVTSMLDGGIIKSILIEIGDHVKKGQTIAIVSNPKFIELQEKYLSTKDNLAFAEIEFKRQKTLNDGNAGAQKNLQSAMLEHQILLTQKSALKKQLQLLGVNVNKIDKDNLISNLTIPSPINGTVSDIFVKIGSYIDTPNAIAEIVNNNSLHLDLQIFEKDLPKIIVGQVIHFTITNNPISEFDAQVFSIGSTFETESKTIAVHCKVHGNKSGLIDGMNITGLVSLNSKTAPAVPVEAIINIEGKDFIYVVTDKKNNLPSNFNTKKSKDSSTQDKNFSEVSFEKIEILKGVTELGYTAITFVDPVLQNAKIAVKGTYYINAKLSDTGAHEH